MFINIKKYTLKELINQIFNYKLIRFIITGGLNTLIGYLIYSSVLFITDNVYATIIITTILNILINFKTYSKLVFYNNDNKLILRFVIVYLSLMFLNLGFVKGCEMMGITNFYLLAAFTTVPFGALSYIMLNKFVFIEK